MHYTIVNKRAGLTLHCLRVLSRRPFRRSFIRHCQQCTRSSRTLLGSTRLTFIRYYTPGTSVFRKCLASPAFLKCCRTLRGPKGGVRQSTTVTTSLCAGGVPIFVRRMSRCSSGRPLPSIVNSTLALMLTGRSLPSARTHRLTVRGKGLGTFAQDLGNTSPQATGSRSLSLFRGCGNCCLCCCFFNGQGGRGPTGASRPVGGAIG